MNHCGCDLTSRLDPGLFRALADPNRLMILSELAHCCGEPRSVSQVAAELPVDVSVVSRHLSALRESGVLASERSGRSVRYRVRYSALAGLLRGLADAIEGCQQGCCGSECADGSGSVTAIAGGGDR
jgi:ArsR family transcriptional regulator